MKSSLKGFSEFLEKVSDFLKSRGFHRVYTPVTVPFRPPDVNIGFFVVKDKTHSWTLRVSPEMGLKRILEEGERIFEIAQCFRKGEESPVHSHEFFMLEWYEPGDEEVLLKRTAEFFEWLKGEFCLGIEIEETDLCEEFKRKWGFHPSELPERKEQMMKELGVDFDVPVDDLFYLAVDEIMRERTGVVLAFGFPSYCFSLAREEDGVTKRLEVYWDGLEVGNGYVEEWRKEALKLRVHPEFPREGIEILGNAQGFVGISFGMDRIYMKSNGLGDLPVKNFWRCETG